jgi:hypothetical protein
LDEELLLGSMATMRSPRSYVRLPELGGAGAARRAHRPTPGESTGRNPRDDAHERTHGTASRRGQTRSGTWPLGAVGRRRRGPVGGGSIPFSVRGLPGIRRPGPGAPDPDRRPRDRMARSESLSPSVEARRIARLAAFPNTPGLRMIGSTDNADPAAPRSPGATRATGDRGGRAGGRPGPARTVGCIRTHRRGLTRGAGAATLDPRPRPSSIVTPTTWISPRHVQ